jgi:hypothetical protein
MSRRIVLVVVAAAAFALGVGQARAHSDPTAVEYAGRWQGFFQSSVTGEIGTFTLNLVATHNRQLDGTLSSPTLPTSLPFHVTVAASDVFTAVSPGGNFVVHGMQDAGFIWFEHGDYRLRLGGVTDLGMLDFFKSFPDADAAQLPSALDGTFVRDDGQTGRISVDVRGQKGSDFQGVAMFGDLPFPYLGSIGAPDDHGMAPVRALSVSPAGTLLITGVWDTGGPEPHLDGMVRAAFGDGSVRTATFELLPAVQTNGG